MKKNVTIQTACFPKIPPFPIFPFPLKRSGIDQDSNVLFPYVRNFSKPSNYLDRSIRRRKGRKKYRNRSSSSPPKKFLLVTGRRRRNASEGISFRPKKRRYYSRGGDVSPPMGLIHGLSWSAYARKGSEEGKTDASVSDSFAPRREIIIRGDIILELGTKVDGTGRKIRLWRRGMDR